MMPLVMNTHLLAQEFELYQPDTLEEVLALLAQHAGQARILAGGTDLLVNMKLERAAASKVIYIGKMKALKQIEVNNGLTIGALVTFYDLQRSAVIKAKYRALAEAAHSVSGTQIKIMGSIGGNLCNASPAADSAPALLLYDSEVELADAGGSRRVRLEEFFLGPGKTVIKPSELLTAIHLSPTGEKEGSAFFKLGRVGADIAKVSVAVRLVRHDQEISHCKIALGAVAPTPVRAYQAESYLTGKEFNLAAADEVSQIAARESRPITDVRSTADYRLHAARVLVRDALLAAWRHSGGGEV